MAENKYGPEDDDSLDQFEQKMRADEKNKARQGYLRIFLIVLVLALGGYLYFSRYMSAPELPPAPPPAPAPKPVEPKVEAPKPPATPVEPAKTAPQPAPAGKQKGKKEEKAADAKKPMKETKTETTKAEKPAKKEATAPEKSAKHEKAETAPKAKASTEGESGKFTVQLGIFAVESNATRLVAKLEKAGLSPQTAKSSMKIAGHSVVYKNFRYREQAEKESAKLLSNGHANSVELTGAGEYTIVFGHFKTEKEAETLAKNLSGKGLEVQVSKKPVTAEVTVVRISGIADSEKLKEVTEKLEKEKLPFVVHKR